MEHFLRRYYLTIPAIINNRITFKTVIVFHCLKYLVSVAKYAQKFNLFFRLSFKKRSSVILTLALILELATRMALDITVPADWDTLEVTVKVCN